MPFVERSKKKDNLWIFNKVLMTYYCQTVTRVSVPFTEGHYYGREKRPNTELAHNSLSTNTRKIGIRLFLISRLFNSECMYMTDPERLDISGKHYLFSWKN